MTRLSRYLKRHHVALLAIVLVLTGGTAYAAKQKLPKNSVASKQVKNGSLLGKDVKDGGLTGTDLGDGSVTSADVGDGSLTGSDIADGSVGATDLSATAVPIVRDVVVTDVVGGAAATVVSDPAIGTITFACGPGAADLIVGGSMPPSAQPGSVRISGHDLADNNPVGASTVTSATVQPSAYGVNFSGGTVIIPQGTLFFDGARKRMSLHWDVSGCILRGLLVIQDKAAHPDLTSKAPGSSTEPQCTEVGAAHCLVD